MLTDHHNHENCTSRLVARAKKICGSRLTGQRRDVLDCISESHAAVGAYDLIGRMALRGPRPAPITIYRALNFLLNHNLIHKVESRNAYVACACAHENAPHALLICDACGTVEEIVPCAASVDLEEAAIATGFVVDRVVVELSGTCKACCHV
jgi:Fur family transcriptional regulator, zinc uptake regulator